MRDEPELKRSIAHLTSGTQPGCLMDLSLVRAVGMVDVHLQYIMDRDLLLRLARIKRAVYIPYATVMQRVVPKVKSVQLNRERATERLRMAKKIFNHPDLPMELRALKRISFASAHRFAWDILGQGGFKKLAVYHLAMDCFYAPMRDWSLRKRLLRRIRNGRRRSIASRIISHES